MGYSAHQVMAENLVTWGIESGLIIITSDDYFELGYYRTPGRNDMVRLLAGDRDLRNWLAARVLEKSPRSFSNKFEVTLGRLGRFIWEG